MKTYTFTILLLLASSIPNMVYGQQQILEAFDAIINCKGAEIEESHYLQRDMDTGVKIGQSDIYEFDLPKGKSYLVKNVLKAFEQDSKMAYSIKSGKAEEKDLLLAVGDGKSNNALLCPWADYFYYACFLAPKEEDADGNFRYAYGISYDDLDDEDEISGRLVITYASTMKHRQENSSINSVRDLSNPETWANDANKNQVKNWSAEQGSTPSNEPWIRVFINYVTALGYSNKHTRATNAGYLYEVTSSIDKYKNVSENDKETARGILNALISDQVNSDPVVQQILKNALANLK